VNGKALKNIQRKTHREKPQNEIQSGNTQCVFAVLLCRAVVVCRKNKGYRFFPFICCLCCHFRIEMGGGGYKCGHIYLTWYE